MLIRDAIDGFLLALRAARASPSTTRLYGSMLARVADFAAARGRMRIDELTVDLARGAIVDALGPADDAARHGPNWKGGEGTAYAMGCALRAFSATLRADGVAVADFSVIHAARPPERIQPRLSAEEFRLLEAAVLRRLMSGRAPRFLVARDLALLSLMADTGLRASEVCALDVVDVDFRAGALTVQRGKGSKPRVLSIRDDDPSERDGGPTLRALRDYLSHRAQTFGHAPRQPALWLTRRGARLQPESLRDMLARLCEEAGVDGNRPPHAFRRGYFSAEYRERPTALPMLKARMGWAPTSHNMVEVYTRGADIDLAREQPQPSVSKRWREGGGRKVPSRRASRQPLIEWDAGPQRAANDAPPTRRLGKEGERAAGKPARGLRPNNTPRNVTGS